MTKRERTLSAALLGVLALGGGAVVLQATFLGPLRQLRDEGAALREEIRKKGEDLKAKQANIDHALKLSPRLALWKQLSLPASKEPRPEAVHEHLEALQVDYEKYLSDLLERSGFEPGSITVSPQPVEAPRARAAAAKGPPPVFRTLSFTVQGQTALDGLVKMLEEFHRASLLQQVRSFNIQKAQERSAGKGALDVKMTVEAILVSGAEKRDALMPETPTAKPHVLAEPARTYADLAAHNIFAGKASASTPARAEDARDVLGFVRLTTVSNVNGRRWEAWLFDQSKKDGEAKLRASAGFNDFSYYDRYDNLLVRGLVLRVDETGVLFKANGRFHHVSVGETLYDALQQPAADGQAAAGAALGAGWAAPW